MTPPKIFRVMKAEGQQPAIGNGSATLGVRAEEIGLDVDTPGNNTVRPHSGGMSVAGCIRTLLPTLLPKRLGLLDPERFRGARASNSQQVWRMGDGPYAPNRVTEDLYLFIEHESDPPGHGLVEPVRPMPLSGYCNALAATRDSWVIDERHLNDCPVCKKFGLD